MKNIFAILSVFVLVFSSVSFAAVECSPSFTENLTVRVLDGSLRFIQGAAVQVYFQLDKTTSKGYKITPPYYTNERGETGRIIIHNIETNPLRVDCEFTVNASYDGKQVKKTYKVGMHSDPIDLQLDAYIVRLTILDQFNNPLEGAEVWFNSIINRTADKNGLVAAHAAAGTLKVLVKYGDGKLESTIKIDKDYTHTIGLQLYPLTITILDDMGKPLAANAVIGTKNLTSNDSGIIKVDKLATATPPVFVKYKNIEKSLDVDLRLQTKYVVVFDSSPPVIDDVKTLLLGKNTKLVVSAHDVGSHPSGIGVQGVTIKYKVSESDSWHDLSVYLSGRDQYVAEIPTQPADIIVHFFVEVKDKDGNRNSLEGQFLSLAPKNDTIKSNTTEGEQNASNVPSQPDVKQEGLPLFYIVGGFIIIVVIIYAIYRYKFGGGGEGG